MHPTSHIDQDGRDLDWHQPGWLAGRCAGGLLGAAAALPARWASAGGGGAGGAAAAVLPL